MSVDATVITIITVLTVGAVLALVPVLCRCVKADINGRLWITAAILAVGFAVRLVFAFTVRGYREDYGMFTDMFDDLATNGVGGYYKGNSPDAMYPIVYFAYLIFGGLSNITGLSDYSLGAQLAVKLPLIICELLTAYGIYKIAVKYFNRAVAYALCAFVCVCPAFYVASTLWSSAVAFTAMFLVYACYSLARKRYAATVAFSTAAAFCGKEGILFFPVVAVFGIFHIVRAARNIAKDKPRGRAFFASDYSAAISVPVAFVASILAVYLLSLFSVASYTFNPFVVIYEFTIKPLAAWKFYTYNGLSIFSVFAKNGIEPSARFPYGLFVGIFAAIVFAVVCVVYFTKRNRATLVMLASYVLTTLQIYYPGSSAVGMYVALPVVLAAYALVRDKRILHVFALFCIVFAVNVVSALANAGYLNNIADYYFGGSDYSGSTLMSGGFGALNIALSAVAVISHLYYTFITVNVGMSGRKLMLNGTRGIIESYRDFFGGRNAVED